MKLSKDRLRKIVEEELFSVIQERKANLRARNKLEEQKALKTMDKLNLEVRQLNQEVLLETALIGKLLAFLWGLLAVEDQIRDVCGAVQRSHAPDALKKVCGKVVDLVSAVDEASGPLGSAADLATKGGNANPLNWKANMFASVIKSFFKPKKDDAEQDAEMGEQR